YTVVAHGLAGVLADISLGDDCDGVAAGARTPARLLDCVFTMAVEIPVRGGCRSADRATANSAWVLSPYRARAAQPAWTLVGVDDRTYPRFYLRRPGDRIGALQSAFRRAAL